MRGLYICSFDPESSTNSYFNEWAENFRMKHFEIFNSFLDSPLNLKKLLNPYYYDLIILGFSCASNLSGRSKQILKFCTKFSKATVIGFLQNEFRNLPDLIKNYALLNVNILVSQLPQETAEKLYKGKINAKIISVPHAMSSRNIIKEINHTKRTIDLGNRLTSYAHYMGNINRSEVIPKFLKKIKKNKNIKTDFSLDPKKRFTSSNWINFLKNCRTSVSSESGSYFLQWNDSLRLKINKMTEINPKISFRYIFNNILKKSSSHIQATAISSRQFDSIATGTCNVLVEGNYSNLLEPDIHYINLKSDLSNYDEVIEKIMDHKFTENIAKKALKHSEKFHTIEKRISDLLNNV
tara:strand:+ start:1366 stop:2421 length:1056 start_codon:yes stop_codon:yes gene_type:complete